MLQFRVITSLIIYIKNIVAIVLGLLWQFSHLKPLSHSRAQILDPKPTTGFITMNDIKLLDFPGLAKTFQQHYLLLRQERLGLAQRVAQRKYQQRVQELVQQFDVGEGGSDGVEESVLESIGSFDPTKITLDPQVVHQCRLEAKTLAVEAWAAKNQISQKLSWLPHQLLAYFGTWTAVRDHTGKFSAPLTWEANTRLREDYYALGSGILATSNRSNFFRDAPKGNQQYKSPINPLVPIILAGFKKFQGIEYGAWNTEGLEVLLDPELAKLVGVTVPEMSTSELLALRNTAITDKTGPRQNIPNNPATCTKLNHLADTSIGHLPKLAKYMVLQTWAAHPSNRSEYMILDPNNWDAVPAPLVGTDIFKSAEPKTNAKTFATYFADETAW